MKRNIIAMALCAILFGCNSEKKSESSDTVSVNNERTTAQSELVSKVIKTADMRFKVKDAVQTKLDISKIVSNLEGSIVESSIQTTTLDQERVAYSADSLQETTVFKAEGVIIARIPPAYLNVFSDLVAARAEQIDSAKMQANDQSIAYLRNSLKTKNREEALKAAKALASKEAKLSQELVDMKDGIVDRKMDNLDLNQKTKLSTVTLSFYQDKGVRKVIVANDNLVDHRPGFFKRLSTGLNSGWQMFQEFLLLIARSWILIVIGIIVFFGFKHFNTKRSRA
ncbi:DUF4349 domain-containing protein [Pedobacter sp. BMA]|uniref:DUF4349 domain-containing protein n=1 Tax=Pedobacter sp. BMA TaxID=1663685 RepID=UPI000649E007|nr:DUF4349 domain-containing protein [Pedobacter sp. BMA]KLT65166.1 hypothetical protein AB669_15905 [Pedobacter sp. BMA]